MTPPSHDFWGISVEGNTLYVHTQGVFTAECRGHLIKAFILFLIHIFRAHIRRRGRTPLWAKWIYSAERAAVWTSGYLSSTCRSDELSAAQTCEGTLISTGRVVWTLMDILPPRDQIQSTAGGERKFRRKQKSLLSTWDVCKRVKKKAGRWISTLDRTVWSCICQPLQPRWDGEAIVSSRDGNLNGEKHACFLLWSWTLYRWIISCICLAKPLWRDRKVGRNQNMELLSGPRPRPLCRNKALVETLDLLQFHLIDLNC